MLSVPTSVTAMPMFRKSKHAASSVTETEVPTAFTQDNQVQHLTLLGKGVLVNHLADDFAT